MQPAGLETTTLTSDDGPTIELRGQIDGGAKEALAAAYDSAPHAGRLLLDFMGVDYINSTGIALIVALLAQARAERRHARDHPGLQWSRLHELERDRPAGHVGRAREA